MDKLEYGRRKIEKGGSPSVGGGDGQRIEVDIHDTNEERESKKESRETVGKSHGERNRRIEKGGLTVITSWPTMEVSHGDFERRVGRHWVW
jgi:hypothetical protein